MGIRHKLLSNPFIRNMIDSLWGRSAYSTTDKTFVTYFQYKIGEYKDDYFLYFNKIPHHRLYTNEIFNKLNEYNGYDIIGYLEFHFEKYTDKNDFLRFLNYELSERLKLTGNKTRQMKLQSARDWLTEKQQEIHNNQQLNLQQEIEKGVQSILQNRAGNISTDSENQAKLLSEKLAKYIEDLMANAEERMQQITKSFTTGNIRLNNHNYEDRLVQLLLLLREVNYGKPEQLFQKFSLSDIAAMLHLHFDAFKDKKLNTVQGDVSQQQEVIRDSNSNKIKNLEAALQEFFH